MSKPKKKGGRKTGRKKGRGKKGRAHASTAKRGASRTKLHPGLLMIGKKPSKKQLRDHKLAVKKVGKTADGKQGYAVKRRSSKKMTAEQKAVRQRRKYEASIKKERKTIDRKERAAQRKREKSAGFDASAPIGPNDLKASSLNPSASAGSWAGIFDPSAPID